MNKKERSAYICALEARCANEKIKREIERERQLIRERCINTGVSIIAAQITSVTAALLYSAIYETEHGS